MKTFLLKNDLYSGLNNFYLLPGSTWFLLLFIIIFISAIVLTIIIYMQSGNAKSAGSAFINNKNLDLFEKVKVRGVDRLILVITWIFIIIFFVVSILILI